MSFEPFKTYLIPSYLSSLLSNKYSRVGQGMVGRASGAIQSLALS